MKRVPLIRSSSSIATLCWFALLGCGSANMDVGTDRPYVPSTDACGNGIDDDRDGRIDEDCF
jgi:hypothetical protein